MPSNITGRSKYNQAVSLFATHLIGLRIGGERCFELVPIKDVHCLAVSTKFHDGEHVCNLPEFDDAS